jgi:hypothetical protein
MPLPARGTIEGLTSPNRVPGGDFVVIFERSEIRALANPALLERSRFRSPERLAADEAVLAESDALAHSLAADVRADVHYVLGTGSPGFVASMSDEAAKQLASSPFVAAIMAEEFLPNVIQATQNPAPS